MVQATPCGLRKRSCLPPLRTKFLTDSLLVTCDSGGSNGARCRLWKDQLAALAAQTGLRIEVCHFPPATSKWNKIEHRMFCHVTRTWRGRP